MKAFKISFYFLLLTLIIISFSLNTYSKILHPPPRKNIPKEVENLLSDISIEKPHYYKNLIIFPVVKKKVPSFFNIISLDEALDKKYIEIGEVGEGNVPEVEVENISKFYVFMMAGEILIGGKQDRMLKDDVLLKPKSGKIKVKVYCIEQRRWGGKESKFSKGGTNANIGVRQKASQTKNQEEVWKEIEYYSQKLSVATATGTLQGVIKDKSVEKKTKEYYDKLCNIPDLTKNTTGVIVAVGNKIMCGDILLTPTLFKKYFKKLLHSYIIEALGEEEKRKYCDIDDDDVENFISNIKEAEFVKETTAGVGDLFTFKSNRITGQTLIFQNEVIHIDLFPVK